MVILVILVEEDHPAVVVLEQLQVLQDHQHIILAVVEAVIIGQATKHKVLEAMEVVVMEHSMQRLAMAVQTQEVAEVVVRAVTQALMLVTADLVL
jgi:hypothetical protein